MEILIVSKAIIRYIIYQFGRRIFKFMEQDKNVLSGENNDRLNKTSPTNKEVTAAWANIEKMQEVSQVTIPSEFEVGKAKNWVDNGSQL